MPLVRYQSPDDSAFVVFDQARFRVEHGIFLLRPGAILARIREVLEEHRDWDLRVMKLMAENQRLQACADWLEKLPSEEEAIVQPELVHEPAIDRVADHLIGAGDFVGVECPACSAAYSPEQVRRESWEFEEEGTAIRGRNTICPQGHILHALRDSIEVPGIELEGD
ncbi:hypothetical protein P12x_004976 [Tundrisphaera lichenicola]|uniref:hypothetical protein n=1 Tax=Tundrisphaera lichenicola TaxID=2029860 RepID=UPI003EB7BAC9